MSPSGLSVAARQLRSQLSAALGMPVDNILIGHPNAAFKQLQAGTDFLNLFVYHVDHGAYPSAGDSRDPLYLSVRCLITSFADAVSGPNGASAGENDLRIMGHVIESMHAQPFLALPDAEGTTVASLQMVLAPMNLDDLNHIWATQPDTPYRLSVAYELALLPLPLATAVARSPKVGVVGLGVSVASEAPVAIFGTNLIDRLVCATNKPDWTPQIAWHLDAPAENPDGPPRMTQFRALPQSPALRSLPVVLVGLPGQTVSVAWSGWDAQNGWSDLNGTGAAQTFSCVSEVADASLAPLPEPVSVVLPDTLRPQMQLCVTRSWQRPDGWVLTLRSNPLLLSFYAPEAA